MYIESKKKDVHDLSVKQYLYLISGEDYSQIWTINNVFLGKKKKKKERQNSVTIIYQATEKNVLKTKLEVP